MLPLCKGHYRARFARNAGEIAAAQDLRRLCFGEGDSDDYDLICKHMLVEDLQSQHLVGVYRFMLLDGATIGQSYAAQFYDLTALAQFTGPMMEMGRFCIHPDHPDPDILRIAWGALARMIDAGGVQLLFGCSSFRGIDARPYHDSFALLHARHLGPQTWRPGVKAPEVLQFSGMDLRGGDLRKGISQTPPLLRSYLAMGGWVSDHAVVDRDMNTLHVFTGLEIAAIPPARARLLRGVAEPGAEGTIFTPQVLQILP